MSTLDCSDTDHRVSWYYLREMILLTESMCTRVCTTTSKSLRLVDKFVVSPFHSEDNF